MDSKLSDPKQRLIKNIFSNWASMLVSIAIAFFMSPFLVHNLGKEQYGIWALALSLIAYSHFLDAGMRQSLARYIPKHYATRDFQKLNEVLSSSNAIYAITGSLVIIGTLVIALFFAEYFHVSSELLDVMKITFLLVGLNEALRFYFITSSALGPFHRYDIGNVIDILTTIANALLIFYFIGKGYALITLAVITVSTALSRFVIRAIYQKRLVPEIEYKFKYVNKAVIRELLGYGVISFFIVMAWMVIFNTDNIVIGFFLGTTEVTFYSIAGMMINYLRTLINAIGIPLVPAISHFDANSDHSQIAGLYTKLSRYLYYLTACIAIGILFYGAKFIYLWMGPDFTSTVKVLYILIIPAAIYLPQVAANSVLLGISRHKILLNILIAEALVNIGLSVALVKPLGIIGVALGTAIPQFIIYSFVYPYVFHRIIKLGLKTFYLTNLKMALIAIALTVPLSFVISRYNPLTGWPGLITNTAIFCTLAGAGFLLWVLDTDDRTKLLARLRIN